ncbi:hypothetical protein ACS0TY_007578 [Phlomoides rotata]
MSELVEMSDTDYFDNLRVNRSAFNRLCYLLRHIGGLVDGRYVTVGEQVALFLSVLSHHSKVRVVKFNFMRSSQTIHTHFHNVLRAVLKLHEVLLAKPTLVTDECTHPSWKYFKGCLGALDGDMDSCTPDQGLKQLRNRNDKGRRGRSVREEQVLSEAMKKIVREGWRTENGFKIGYLKLLSTYMKQEFHNTDLNPEPHITSRITKDPNARLMRSKSWPLYEDWCEIFGQSRATDEASVTVSHLRATTSPPSFSANINVDSASYKVRDETQDESQSPSGIIQNFCDNASNKLGDIAQRIGHDQDMSSSRRMIYSSISKMNMLTLQEKLRATTLIACNAEDIDVLFSLPDPARMEWVMMLLNGDI